MNTPIKKKITFDDLIYVLNENEEKLAIFDSKYASGEILIPRSVIYKTKEFNVTTILKDSFKNTKLIRSIKISLDSKLQKIENNAFNNSSVEDISIPSDIVEIDDGWIRDAKKLKKINIIIKEKQNIINYKEELILGKTNIKSDNYDVVLFAKRDIQNIIIPNNIKQISSYSFAYSSIKTITIPSTITRICEGAFYETKSLQFINIHQDSQLQVIDKNAFAFSSINRISIPSSIKEIGIGWIRGVVFLEQIKILENDQRNVINYNDQLLLMKTNIESDVYDDIIYAKRSVNNIVIPNNIKRISPFSFAYSNVLKISIPSSVTQICKYAFYMSKCKQLEIPADSNLQIIGKQAFNNYTMQNITIPSSLLKFYCGQSDFYSMKISLIQNDIQNLITYKNQMILGKTDKASNQYDVLIYVNKELREVEIPPCIKIIGEHSFCYKLIEKIFIPSQVTEIGLCAFSSSNKLHHVEIQQDSILQIIDRFSFLGTSIEKIHIPSHVKRISEKAFYLCGKLKFVEFSKNSELEIIEQEAFVQCAFEKFSIPQHVKKIGFNAFKRCYDLKLIEVPFNSELQIIEEGAFASTSIEEISIPSDIVEIDDGWIRDAKKLKKINIIIKEKQNIINYKEELILGKTNIKSDNYDVVLFAKRDIQNIIIPNNIKQISSYSFAYSSIKTITIPSTITRICEGAFYETKSLQFINIPQDSQLQTIEPDSFYRSSIKSIFIPQNVKYIFERAFYQCKYLKCIQFQSDSNIIEIDNFAFYGSKINCIVVPPRIIKIQFNSYSTLMIEIDENSSLRSIDFSLYFGKNFIIMVPSNLKDKFFNK